MLFANVHPHFDYAAVEERTFSTEIDFTGLIIHEFGMEALTKRVRYSSESREFFSCRRLEFGVFQSPQPCKLVIEKMEMLFFLLDLSRSNKICAILIHIFSAERF